MSKQNTQAQWMSLGAAEQFTSGSLTTVKSPPHQLVVARTDEGEIHVLDNRCPHEGYPLAQGDLKGCALTCCWHNWKFDVRDGSCTLGGEGVRRFPSKVENGEVLCDVTEPDPAQFFPTWKASLFEGLFRYENGRAIRDGVRLLQGGYAPRDLLVDVARYDADHAEYGSTHALAVCADLMRVLDRYEGMNAMHAIAQAMDMCAESNQRMPERKRPAPIEGATLEELRRAVEAEEAERAEGLLLGAFDWGVSLETIDEWMYACLSDHFLSFGHPLIYMTKLQEMSASLSRDAARAIYGSLLFGTVYSTREDTLPYMSAYSNFLREVEKELPAIAAGRNEAADFDAAAFRDSILEDKGPAACASLWSALKAGVAPTRIADALVGAGAHRLLRFDVPIDSDYDVAETWVWATHRMTFASAVRNAVERFDQPDAIRFLFQAVAFINSGRGMDAPVDRRAAEGLVKANLDDLLASIASKDADRAIQIARGLLATPNGFESLRIALEDLVLEDGPVRPIVVAHLIKTAFCAIEEFARLEGHVDRAIPILAVIRLAASPVQERRVRNVVQNSIAWVGEGRMPRKLTQ